MNLLERLEREKLMGRRFTAQELEVLEGKRKDWDYSKPFGGFRWNDDPRWQKYDPNKGGF